jgi:hypothetical protein
MSTIKNQELLKDGRVQEEISRHRWIESEKAGKDIGFDKASTDWLNRFSDAWIQYNSAPKAVSKAEPKADAKRSAKKMGKK